MRWRRPLRAGVTTDRCPAFCGSSKRHSFSVQAERLEGPGVAQRPLFSLAFQSKHLEKNTSKYGHA